MYNSTRFFRFIWASITLLAKVIILIIISLLFIGVRIILHISFAFTKQYRLLSIEDSIFMHETKMNKNVWGALLQYEGKTTMEEVSTVIYETFVSSKTLDGKQFSENCTKYPKKYFGYYAWVPEAHFKISEHVVDYGDHNVIDVEHLKTVVQTLMSKTLPPNRSPWKVTFFPLKGDFHGKSEKLYYCLLFQFHHCLGDGGSFLLALERYMSQNYVNKLSYNDATAKGFNTNLICIIKKKIALSYKLIEEHLFQDINPMHGPQLSGEIFYRYSSPVNLKQVKTIRRLSGFTLTSVMVAGVTGGLRKLLQKKGLPIPERFRSIIPLSINPNKKIQIFSNDFGYVIINLPLKNKDRHQRLEAIAKQLKEHTAIGLPTANTVVRMLLTSCIPDCILKIVLNQPFVTCAISNLAGASQHLMDRKGNLLKSLALFMCLPSRQGIGLSIVSYNEEVRVGICVDKTILNSEEDVQFILDSFVEEINELSSMYECIISNKN